MPKTFLAALLTLAALSPLAAAAPADAVRTAHRPDPVSQGVYVIGDSITWRIDKHLMTPRNRPAGWSMQGFPGRRVTALGTDYVAPVPDDYWTSVEHIYTPAPRTRVRTVVLALGTNGADDDITVEQAAALYRSGIDRVRAADIWKPGPRRIVLVTPFKIPSIKPGATRANGQPWLPYTWAYKQAVYAAAIRSVARQTAGVCVMPWRSAVKGHAARYLADGIHPNALGMRLWRSLLFTTIRSCR